MRAYDKRHFVTVGSSSARGALYVGAEREVMGHRYNLFYEIFPWAGNANRANLKAAAQDPSALTMQGPTG